MSCATVNPTLLEVNIGDLGIEVNLVARQGADADRIVITLRDTAGNLVDLTGATVEAKIRPSIDAAVAAVFVCSVAGTEAYLDLPAATLAALTAGTTLRDPAGLYVWDARITFVDTTARWLAWGELRVLKPVTRA